MKKTGQDGIQCFAFVISACAAAGLCFCFAWNSGTDDPDLSRHGAELTNRINPNEASIESMARLPGLGPGRAGTIVAYREGCGRSPAFRDHNDLQNVTGIGPKTVQSISEWIEFE